MLTSWRGNKKRAAVLLLSAAACVGKLGAGSAGLSDAESGLYPTKDAIQTLAAGDVALLKGESWEGNEGAGLVHRSPAVKSGQQRLLLTLDFAVAND